MARPLVFAAMILLSGAQLPAATFTVNSTADTDDGTCNAANCTFREAINAANASAGTDTIRFVIGSGVKTIVPLAPLPVIFDSVTIDGTTQPGYAGSPIIELNGSSAGTGANGLYITAGSNVVTGLVINRFLSAFPSLGGNGILLESGSGTVVRGCYLGLNVAGTAGLGNGGDGILVSNSSNNLIGRTDVSQRINVISGNGRHGVEVTVGGADGNVIAGDRIGTNAAGTAAVSNGSVGIEISAGANNVVGSDLPGDTLVSGNTADGISLSGTLGAVVKNCWVGLNAAGTAAIGNGGQGIDLGGVSGATIGPGNVASGNALSGILLVSGSTGNTVTGNYAGTNSTGTAAIGNLANGIIVSSSNDNTIGPGNLSSGNGTNGVRIRTGSSGNVVIGNAIGVNGAITAALPNALEGVQINDGAHDNTVGGPAGDRNVISGNTGNGVLLLDAETTGNVIRGNFIGTNATASLALPNGSNGVDVQGGASGNTIGGTAAGTKNVISLNAGRGVFVESGTGNAVLGNTISYNGGLGIDLGPAGVTPNDPGDPDPGANLLQNFPVLSSVVLAPSSTEIHGSLESLASLTFHIELFATLVCDASGNGPGQRPLGAVDTMTDAGGDASFVATIPGPALGPWITATATDPSNDTSEFSACFPTPPPQATGMSPVSGPAAGNTPVVILGSNFQAPAVVRFGSTPGSMVIVASGSEVDAASPTLLPGALYDVVVVDPSTLSATLPAAWFADFTDVPAGSLFHDDVEKIFRAAITAGCGGGNYCPSNPVSRQQMAVFLLKAEHGSSYTPPDCTGQFDDVPCPSTFANWIEQLSAEGITAGCGGSNFCPTGPVTRQQMAVFLLKTEHGSNYTPPACAGVFEDVLCPSQYADWIEQLYAEAITGGCQTSPLLYCPTSPVNRGQMATFLTNTFGF